MKDASGKPLSGMMGITFGLYKDQEGGAALWLETQNVPLDTSGHYSVLLGATKEEGVPMELFTSGEARWLDTEVQGQPKQARVLLVSVPYALKAADADTVGGMSDIRHFCRLSLEPNTANIHTSCGVIRGGQIVKPVEDPTTHRCFQVRRTG